ncbi:ECF RNA polymerase sigma factor SigK [Leifsonia sp. F6_8S_P_1B]|uniref:ECF RNA polymerase sigma factor SigK n=1 Tax=Leifsonia williamsii TaxID=3035919 RepID=A0ABT8KF35_9MICO|nr:ECF RNA polymerase sigma factor SigK [Leifsonia williamsii]MDN4616065.1 ECF RNA polymerase sigma factor SigK [Leifsonia williamsii]
MDDATVDLDALLTATASGDQRAFSEFYDRTASRVLGLIRRILIDAAQSEEVAQEVFLEAWQSAARFDPNRGRALTWILTMAHRRAIDRVRASQAAHDRDAVVGVRDLPTAYDEVAETVEVRVEHERVEGAMAVLSEQQREAVALAYYGGLSQSEVAARLGIPLGTAKTRLRDAMIRLREELGVTR